MNRVIENTSLWFGKQALSATLLFLFTITIGMAQEDIRVMSFNIRFANPEDGVNYWPNRKGLVASMIRFQETDIVGLQEAMRSQLDDLVELLPDYAWYGLCRTDGSAAPEPDNEFSAILYRKARFELLENATFWLSEKPEVVGSTGWDAALPRISSWVRFKDKASGKEFYHFNTHFDHRGVQARAESARLLLKQIREIAGEYPVILTGDFNCVPTDEPYRILTDNNSSLADALFRSEMPHHGPLSTWSAFQ
ncbi:MAG: endonuclease/exonuclease/phosphatase family protein, partial [Phaeodactylibacter sp.]|nr:endonuclease/exonuclease/phosphatase family protein [Phaeodactylibacter sp.]